jgi:hypothetical protein
MTNNIFLKAENGSFLGQETIYSSLQYNFVQDLIQVDWNVQAHFNRSNGFLLYYQVYETESLWIIPEIVGILIIWFSIILFYELLRKNIQKVFDEKQDAILKAQASNSNEESIPYRPKEEIVFDSEKYPVNSETSREHVSNGNLTKDKDLKTKKIAKKLTWEEYKKLEES